MVLNIVIVADRNMEVGLHTTSYSAMKFLDHETRAVFHLFLRGYDGEAFQRIRSTLSEFDGKYEIKVYSVDELDLGKGRGLHFNKMNYVKLHVPQIIDVERLLYLDADVLILTDLGKLFFAPLDGKIAGAALSGVIVKYAWEKDRKLLNLAGVPDDAPYFNSGVLLFDVNLWRQHRLTQASLSFIRKHYKLIYNGDQVVLNAVLHNNIALLPGKYNVPFYPTKPVLNLDSEKDLICHFVGSPKPWDLFGEFLHASYPAFRRFLKWTYFANYKSYKNISVTQFLRTICIARRYYVVLREKLKSR